jgi:cell division protein FtsN
MNRMLLLLIAFIFILAVVFFTFLILNNQPADPESRQAQSLLNETELASSPPPPVPDIRDQEDTEPADFEEEVVGDYVVGEQEFIEEPAETAESGAEMNSNATAEETRERNTSSAESSSSTGSRTTASAPQPSRPVPEKTTAPSASQTSSPPKTTPTAQRSAESWWIQVGSYSSTYRAQQAKETLKSKGVVSRIVTRTVDGTTYYRVRIGPYNSEPEASGFLPVIQSISGFESSYISKVIN